MTPEEHNLIIDDTNLTLRERVNKIITKLSNKKDKRYKDYIEFIKNEMYGYNEKDYPEYFIDSYDPQPEKYELYRRIKIRPEISVIIDEYNTKTESHDFIDITIFTGFIELRRRVEEDSYIRPVMNSEEIQMQEWLKILNYVYSKKYPDVDFYSQVNIKIEDVEEMENLFIDTAKYKYRKECYIGFWKEYFGANPRKKNLAPCLVKSSEKSINLVRVILVLVTGGNIIWGELFLSIIPLLIYLITYFICICDSKDQEPL